MCTRTTVPPLVGAHLHEVAELVDEPQAAAAERVRPRSEAAGERVADATVVAHLAQGPCGPRPQPQRCRARSACRSVVRRELVDREHEVPRRDRRRARRSRARRRRSRAPRRASSRPKARTAGRWVGRQRACPRTRRPACGRGGGARSSPALGDVRVGVARLLDDVRASSPRASYGHSRSKPRGLRANARLSSASWRWHSTSSSRLRPGQAGSPIPRSGRPRRRARRRRSATRG